MRVLLIEDDRSAARAVELMLKAQGVRVEIADCGEAGVELGEVYDYDLILLDLNLPDMNGIEVLRELRRGRVGTPVMIVSATAEVDAKVKAFAGGADDYMVKPLHKDELIARLRAVVRRSQGHAQSIIKVGDIEINMDAKMVHVSGRHVHVTGREYQILELLALRKGKTLSKEVFLDNLYGGMDEPGAKIIDVFICKLRKKLSIATDGKHNIETVWGGGYALREPGDLLMQSAA